MDRRGRHPAGWRGRGLLACALALAVLPGAADGPRRVEIYEPRQRMAEELLPVAETALAGEGRVVLEPGTNSLVLIGAPGAVAQALELLASQDRPPRSVVLRFDTKRLAELAERGLAVRWTAVAGDFRIGNVRALPGQGSSLDLRARDALETLAASFAGTLRLREGTRARVETGTSTPFPTGATGSATDFVTAGTGSEASARILADGRVQVDLAAFVGRFGRGGRVDGTRASTLVLVEPGETLVVAGLGPARASSRERSLRGTSTTEVRDETVLLLRADVE